ncbi:hypothetical protein A6770_22540 [Nostoc minutum NIES-26]|uniref:Uncharacterized protein n=1 Tax=Nostoc minutum NIES-26 TaxID=1844469 RepID=A0A367R0Y1_9NOSO|nr:hypothetical protein A6770_22540 [Nostoc minutum NIES-26]
MSKDKPLCVYAPLISYQVRLITYDMSLRVKRSGTKQSLRTLRLLHFAIAAFVMTSIYPDMRSFQNIKFPAQHQTLVLKALLWKIS